MRPALLPVLLLMIGASCASESPTEPVQPASSDPSSSVQPAETSSKDPVQETPKATGAAGLYQFEAKSLDGSPADLSGFGGQVTLVVNVASRCGYTRQYAGLQELHAELSDRGFAVLAFPSNEFGGQEPGTPDEIRNFCTSKFGVTFPMFAKCEVKPGPGQSPVYAYLQEQTDEVPGWNFCKYLVGKDGRVLAFFGSSVEPGSAELRKAIMDAIG